MRKVLVIGSGGAGKSTFARRLAERTGLPLVHLDLLYWHDGWVPSANAEWDGVVARLVSQDDWIMDGNYGRTMVTRLAACDTVIFLDIPRWRCMWRLVRRRLVSLFTPRTDLPSGCPDRLTWEFIVWVWNYPTRRRPDVIQRLKALRADQQAVVLTSQHAADAFLAGMAS